MILHVSMNYINSISDYFSPQQQTTYFDIAKTYYTSAVQEYIHDQNVINTLPIVIPIIVMISLGNIYNIGKNIFFITLRICIGIAVYIACTKLYAFRPG